MSKKALNDAKNSWQKEYDTLQDFPEKDFDQETSKFFKVAEKLNREIASRKELKNKETELSNKKASIKTLKIKCFMRVSAH